MKAIRVKFIIVGFILIVIHVFSKNTELSVEGYGLLGNSGQKTTHWIYSEENGMFNKFDEKFGSFINYKGELKKIEFGTKIKISNGDREDKLNLKELYIGKKWKNYLAFIGKNSYEKANEKSNLSIGSLLVSDNAESPFRIHFGTNGYIPIFGMKEKLFINASMSNSILESDRVCKSPYLHEKEAYLKLKVGKTGSVYGGVSHAVLWGGELNGKKINSSFMDFISVIIVDNKGGNSIQTEIENKIGDHKGIYELGYNGEVKNKNIDMYYQHFFEDRDGMKFNNLKDMLLGMKLKSKDNDLIKEVLFEYLYTKHQGGTGTHLETGGQDFYYYNYLYGPWAYKDMVIGNSLFVTEGSGKDLKIVHSRIKAFHLGIKGNFTDELKYTTMVTYSENFGTCADIAKDIFTKGKKQWYTYFEVEKNNLFKYENLSGKIGIGYDDGEIFNRVGVMTLLKYSFK